MYALFGDGSYVNAEGVSPSAQFLLRAWVWPATPDLWIFGALGITAGTVGYSMSQAYRLAAAATIAPFEYLLMIYALFWGWTIFGEWPAPTVFAGAAIIIASGIYIVWRERVT